ncbi:DUF4270 domain-containing protein [uncultured Winogradskyella sp.]|uniref:DUF4270 domain-containing protein n=1 Tax=uncultured Winogradskyella sp. TaxID=395353 RepID=UPI002601CD8C|nr:DUF4270 domain-containing protein [uncultured Winogradskyella sp.]
MKKNKFALKIIAPLLVILSFIACDSDFTTLESDVINDDVATNFDILSLSETNPSFTEIISYTDALGPVQTNSLGINSLGVYDDLYGRTTSTFVTQLTPSTLNSDLGEEIEIDSVVLTIPYFSFVSDVSEDGDLTYEIDSVIGRNPIKLSLFESNYFLRDFNPEGEFNESQAYFSNQSASASESISDAALEGTPIPFVANPENNEEVSLNADGNINITENGYILTEENEDGDQQLLERVPPGLRLKLDPEYWQGKIMDEQVQPFLSSQNVFSEYFRGLYFKVEPVNENGSFLILNFASQNANITIYYKRSNLLTDDEEDRERTSLNFSFAPNRVNFFNNEFTTPINEGEPSTGDARLFLKGGEGSVAKIKLFNGDNLTFNAWKDFFVETDNDGKFQRSRRLVNEANLVFYVDRDALDLAMQSAESEPNRLYIYDADNNVPLPDFFFDLTNNTFPNFSKINHLGPLERVANESTGDGIKYKLKITEHINNLLLRDSTNVELGVAVSLNVNLEEQVAQRNVQTADDSDLRLPVSSIVSPRGTILHGSNSEDENKRVYLEIFYTEPNN